MREIIVYKDIVSIREQSNALDIVVSELECTRIKDIFKLLVPIK